MVDKVNDSQPTSQTNDRIQTDTVIVMCHDVKMACEK